MPIFDDVGSATMAAFVGDCFLYRAAKSIISLGFLPLPGTGIPFSLNFFRENDFSTAHADLASEEEVILNGMTSAFRVIEANLPRRSLLASLRDRANLAAPHSRTCGVGQNYLVFD